MAEHLVEIGADSLQEVGHRTFTDMTMQGKGVDKHADGIGQTDVGTAIADG